LMHVCTLAESGVVTKVEVLQDAHALTENSADPNMMKARNIRVFGVFI